MLNGNLNIRTGSFGILPLSYLNAQVYIFLLYQIAEFLAKVTNKIARRLTDWIALVGRWSIIYVCTNHGALLLGKTFWRPAGLLAGSLGEVFLEFITAMFIMAGIALIVRKTILREVFAL